MNPGRKRFQESMNPGTPTNGQTVFNLPALAAVGTVQLRDRVSDRAGNPGGALSTDFQRVPRQAQDRTDLVVRPPQTQAGALEEPDQPLFSLRPVNRARTGAVILGRGTSEPHRSGPSTGGNSGPSAAHRPEPGTLTQLAR